MLPDMTLLLKSSTCSSLKFPNSGQIVPFRPLSFKNNDGGKFESWLYCRPLVLLLCFTYNGILVNAIPCDFLAVTRPFSCVKLFGISPTKELFERSR
uniref:Uncharacterized protein n=1 Tax=Arundo donax TaxID=35708 RepID=A0A0A9GR18_ARUDO